MTAQSAVRRFAVVAALAASVAAQGVAQSATPPAPPSPPTPPKVIVPASAVLPADSAVALCMDGSWIYAPGTASACSTRGGLRVAMPPRATPPAVVTATTRSALVAEPVSPAVAPPAGSTMQCKDGTFLFGAPGTDRCADKGGVAATFARPTPAPPRPARP